MQRTAIEEDGVHARAIPEEIGQVARDRAVGRIGKAPVAQTRLRAKGSGARIADREKAVEHQPLDLVLRQRRRLRPGHEARPPARQRHDVMFLRRAGARKRALFEIAARRDEMIPLRTGHPPTFRNEPRLHEDREGQIDIVAAEQNMFADRNPLDVGKRAGRAGPEFEQTEIRSAAADIDDQDAPRLGRVPVYPFPQGLGRGVSFQPAVERGLRLFQEPHADRETGFSCGVQREALRGGVERRRHCDGDLLPIECEAGSGETAVPGVPQGAQDQRGGADRRDLLRRLKIVRSPGQNWRGAVRRMVAQPRLRRPHNASGRFPRPAPGEAAGNPSPGSARTIPRRARPPADRGTRAGSAPRPERVGLSHCETASASGSASPVSGT